MTNNERCILQALISELYDWTRIFEHAYIPIDTKQWVDVYDGMGPSSRITDNFDSKFQDVLRISVENFPKYKFRLRIEKTECKNKVFLEYTTTIVPDEQE
jgi:hypothetical protein